MFNIKNFALFIIVGWFALNSAIGVQAQSGYYRPHCVIAAKDTATNTVVIHAEADPQSRAIGGLLQDGSNPLQVLAYDGGWVIVENVDGSIGYVQYRRQHDEFRYLSLSGEDCTWLPAFDVYFAYIAIEQLEPLPPECNAADLKIVKIPVTGTAAVYHKNQWVTLIDDHFYKYYSVRSAHDASWLRIPLEIETTEGTPITSITVLSKTTGGRGYGLTFTWYSEQYHSLYVVDATEEGSILMPLPQGAASFRAVEVFGYAWYINNEDGSVFFKDAEEQWHQAPASAQAMDVGCTIQ